MNEKYDRKLEEYFYSKSWENDWTRLTISVLSYNKGHKKMKISRWNTNTKGQVIQVNLGRLTKEETEGILPLIQDAIKFME